MCRLLATGRRRRASRGWTPTPAAVSRLAEEAAMTGPAPRRFTLGVPNATATHANAIAVPLTAAVTTTRRCNDTECQRTRIGSPTGYGRQTLATGPAIAHISRTMRPVVATVTICRTVRQASPLGRPQRIGRCPACQEPVTRLEQRSAAASRRRGRATSGLSRTAHGVRAPPTGVPRARPNGGRPSGADPAGSGLSDRTRPSALAIPPQPRKSKTP